jgi:hypothetical protein
MLILYRWFFLQKGAMGIPQDLKYLMDFKDFILLCHLSKIALVYKGNKYFDVNEFTRAKEERELGRFKESDTGEKLTRLEVSKILNYVLSLSIIRNASESVITEVFGRINSYGHRLSDQERRQAGLVSEFSQFVRSMACEIRGDVSFETLPLYQMPEISWAMQLTPGHTISCVRAFWRARGRLSQPFPTSSGAR